MKLFIVMAILLAPLAQTVSAQSNCSQSKSNSTVQCKQEKKNKKTNAKAQKEPSKAAKQGKKTTSTQDIAYALAYKAGIPKQ